MKRLIFLLPLLLIGCSPKIVTVNTETVREVIQVVHDTTIQVKLDVIRDSVAILDTLSHLSNKYAYSVVSWRSGTLNHSLGIKDVAIPVRVQYISTTVHDTTSKTIIQPLSKSDQNKLSNFDKVDAKSKKRASTIFKLYGIISLLGLWILRKPIIKLIKLL